MTPPELTPSPRGQLVRPLSLAFQVPEPLDLPTLDRWLFEILAVPPLSPGPAMHPLQASTSERAAQWLWRPLQLAMDLLQTSRIPVFDAPRVLALSPDRQAPGKWLGTVALPSVDGLADAVYLKVLNVAVQLCEWAHAHPVDGDNTEAFLAMVAKTGVERFSKAMAGGKSTLQVLRAAHEHGIPFIHLGAGVFQLGWGRQARRIERSTTELDSAMGLKLAQSKSLTAKLLRMAGLPAPEHQIVDTAAGALLAARRLGWPVVVKPTDRDRGEGVTVDVTNAAELTRAFESAATLSRVRQVIVERQVPGTCHRLFIANGKLLYAVKRLPMSVEADGTHSVAELVDGAVRAQRKLPPWKRSEIQPLDELARTAIAAAGYTESSVPARGVRIPLRRIESTAWGGVDEESTDRVHPENLRVSLAATELFALSVAGIDIITPDIARPWFENGAILNEVNYAPLLGGGDISRRHIPAFLDDLLGGNGRIPVEICVGGDAAWQAAQARWQALRSEGLGACLTSDALTLSPSGDAWPMPFKSAFRRARALLLSSRVEAVVVVMSPEEFRSAGSPFEGTVPVQRLD